MGKIVPNSAQRALQRVFSEPANQAAASARQQSGVLSGQVPGTNSSSKQPAVMYGLLQPGTSGDLVAAVGHTVLDNAGLPVMVFGNLSVSGDSGFPPMAFTDGGWVLIDVDGNAFAGYSHTTGLWGFGGSTQIGVWRINSLDCEPVNSAMNVSYRGVFNDNGDANWGYLSSLAIAESIQVGPFTFAAGGIIAAFSDLADFYLPKPSNDDLDGQINIIISSLDGSQTALLQDTSELPVLAEGDTSGSFSASSLEFEPGVGTDLAWDLTDGNGTLTTTLGGVYWFIIDMSLGYD